MDIYLGLYWAVLSRKILFSLQFLWNMEIMQPLAVFLLSLAFLRLSYSIWTLCVWLMLYATLTGYLHPEDTPAPLRGGWWRWRNRRRWWRSPSIRNGKMSPLPLSIHRRSENKHTANVCNQKVWLTSGSILSHNSNDSNIMMQCAGTAAAGVKRKRKHCI